jgi:Domain of unknown function (DUF4169)
MADVINLRLARKAKARSAAAHQADENRARHGQTKGAKAKLARETERAARLLDGAKREEP